MTDDRMSSSCGKKAQDEKTEPKRSPGDFVRPESEKAEFVERMRAHYHKIGVDPTLERLEEDWEFVRDF
jgi:hypothetical protein